MWREVPGKRSSKILLPLWSEDRLEREMKTKKSIIEQYDSLIKERDDIKQRIKNTETSIQKILDAGNVKDHVKGGEGGLQTFHIDGFPVAEYDEKVYLLSKYKRQLKERESMIDEMLLKVEDVIKSINNSRMRRIFTYRCEDELNWATVAIKMGGNSTGESVRKEYERFLKKL